MVAVAAPPFRAPSLTRPVAPRNLFVMQCGHPCESKVVHLRDQQGQDHLVLADMGCRNTVFNAQAQSGR